ncbi:MAG TPA: DMT family transporter [Reyranellaceae bacterium]|nr:DMT family transporter [Reyranellaceae bacterium]
MTASSSSHALSGIYYRMGALVLFCTMDAMVKELGDRYGSFQLMLFRTVIAAIPLAYIIHRAGGLHVVKSKRPWLQVARVVTGFASLFGFFYVFPRMPLVDAYAISYAAPLFMTALAVPLLGEPVGWRRWSAVVVGFAGVLLMLDPWGISFHAMSLIVLGATFAYALSTVLIRLISRHDHDAASIFWFSVAASAVSLVGAIPEWKWPSAIDWVWLVGVGLLGGVAQIFSTRALRLAEAGVLAPFDYASIVLAVLFGYLWFKEEPSSMVWWGLPLVIGSGLYILHRERIRHREASVVKALNP